ncbi:site-specific integrase [Paenibacillus sp. JMULE4]|nr:site-specific integrase [Paenibacillus sp. JMULE4]
MCAKRGCSCEGILFQAVWQCETEIQTRTGYIYTLFQVDYSSITASPPERIKSISSFVFSELLTLCDIHYPQLKLALCLQAFAGLRRGEVCNVSQDKIQYSMYGLDIGWFSINLKEVTQLRTDGIITGGIKKRRIQPVHPVFLSMFQEIYNQHLKLIEHVKNPFGALFLNRYGEAMTSQDYENKFTRLVKLLIERLLNNGDFLSLSEANLLMSGRMNTHVLRHFFTQFISELEQTRSPVEIAYWRGDSSLETAIIYLSHHPLIDDKISFIQKKVYEDLSR